jgi:hypothetical protein
MQPDKAVAIAASATNLVSRIIDVKLISKAQGLRSCPSTPALTTLLTLGIAAKVNLR